MVEHTSNLAILAAPSTHTQVEVKKGATERLLTVARRNFDEVVVDAGSHWSWMDDALFEQAKTIYLVTQVGISELRNANRVITGGLSAYGEKLEIILNRHEPINALVEDDVIKSALTKSATWRVPSDYMTIRDMQTLAKPLVLTDKPIAQSIQVMAQKALGIQPQQLTKPKRILGIF
jgi:Flp pilus assembly CpaE family ATPase